MTKLFVHTLLTFTIYLHLFFQCQNISISNEKTFQIILRSHNNVLPAIQIVNQLMFTFTWKNNCFKNTRFSLFLFISHYFSLFLAISRYFSLFLTISHYFSQFLQGHHLDMPATSSDYTVHTGDCMGSVLNLNATALTMRPCSNVTRNERVNVTVRTLFSLCVDTELTHLNNIQLISWDSEAHASESQRKKLVLYINVKHPLWYSESNASESQKKII